MKQWCKLLLQKEVTHIWENGSDPPEMKLSKLELKFPTADLNSTYARTRLFGLTPEQKSFLFKFTYNLLPTKERLHRVGKSASAHCTFCPTYIDNTEHLFSCVNVSHLMEPLSNCLRIPLGNFTISAVISLNYENLESMEFPVIWLLVNVCNHVWDDRMSRKRTTAATMRNELLARVKMLMDTKKRHYVLHNSALLLHELISQHYH